MTWSIVARDPATGHLGVAVASRHVDDHADPLAELHRLYAVAQERCLHVAETMATRRNPSGLIDRGEIDETIAALEAQRLATGRPSASFATPPKT